jgi:hypothetical protein
MKVSTWRSALSGASPLVPNTVTDHVSLSPSRVSRLTLPSGMRTGPRRPGRSGPVKKRV